MNSEIPMHPVSLPLEFENQTRDMGPFVCLCCSLKQESYYLVLADLAHGCSVCMCIYVYDCVFVYMSLSVCVYFMSVYLCVCLCMSLCVCLCGGVGILRLNPGPPTC